jgi:hypothetical protein
MAAIHWGAAQWPIDQNNEQNMAIYCSKLHATLKRNFQIIHGVAWLELLGKHVPDRHEHMVRYYGRYRAAPSVNARRSKSPTLNPRARRARPRKPSGRS